MRVDGKRLSAALAVAICLLPGTCLHSPPERPDSDAPIAIAPVDTGKRQVGEARVVGGWQLSSENTMVGGYSALLLREDGRRLLAGSDSAQWLSFARPDLTADPGFRIGGLRAATSFDKLHADLEALTQDRAGTVWAAYERDNAIVRYDQALTEESAVRPAGMSGWGRNSGPETLAMLPDGQFLVISEGADRWFGSHHRVLLFEDDPLTAPPVRESLFLPPKGFRPVDATALPDGRVLVLLRRLRWVPPGFETRIVVVPSAAFASPRPASGKVIAALDNHPLAENYEGIAALPNTKGGATIWLISDDNFNAFQRTLLVKLEWDGTPAARRTK